MYITSSVSKIKFTYELHTSYDTIAKLSFILYKICCIETKNVKSKEGKTTKSEFRKSEVSTKPKLGMDQTSKNSRKSPHRTLFGKNLYR